MKIDLGLDYKAIINRINKEKEGIKPGGWAKKIGVSINIISNVHGKTKQKPSLEYIIAVSKATGKPVDCFLWGDEEEAQNDTRLPHSTIVDRFVQKDVARELNWNAIKLERLNPDALHEVIEFTKFKIGQFDKRKGERRQQDSPDLIPDGRNRRSGRDRRKVGT